MRDLHISDSRRIRGLAVRAAISHLKSGFVQMIGVGEPHGSGVLCRALAAL